MPLSLVTGPANSGKANVVLQALRGHLARGEGDPLLVVPTDADQARYRRELAESGASMGVRVERFRGLFAEVLMRAGLGEATLGGLARERLLASLADSRFARAGAPGLVKALAESIAELEVARISPDRLRKADSSGLSEVYAAYQETLLRIKRADLELRTTRALDELRRRPSLWGQDPVLLYGFDSFTELELDAIETLGGVVDAPVTVSLAYEPGRLAFAGRAAAFQRLIPLSSTHTELPARAEHYASSSRAALHHLERSLFEERPDRVEPGDAVRLIAGASPRDELELVAREVRALLDDGARPEEIAIVHRSPETVGALLTEALDEHGVPHSLRLRERFGHSASGRALLGLLRCALAAEDAELDDLLAWLRAPGLLDRPELVDRLEARARRLGVRDAERARELWETEHWQLDRIERLRQAAMRGPVALLDAAGAELARLFAVPRSREASILDRHERAEARALAGAQRALEELRDLARAVPEHAPSANELIETLDRLEIRDRSPAPARTVAVVDPLSLRARRVRALFVCGLQEGVFPAPPRPRGLLSGEERRNLVLGAGIRLAGEDGEDSASALARERYLLYALCSRPEERLTLSWHTAQEDGSPAARSLFVDDVCDLFDERLSGEAVRAAGSAEEIIVRRIAGDGPIEPLRDERSLAELRERTQWSASSLECFNACPVRWFVERVLRPESIDPDSEALSRGALAHAALKQTLQRLREQTGSGRITPASLSRAKRLLGEALDDHAERHPLSVSPERVPGARRRLRSDLERYLEWAAENDSGLEPSDLEVEFEDLALGEGVSVRGRIDRIDIAPQGDVVVYDYKARTATPSAKWADEGALQVALYMSAAEHLLDRRVIGGFYQPLSGKDLRPRGVVDDEHVGELPCVRTDKREREEMRELLEQCRRIALDAAGQARAGALEARPHTCSYGGGCMYPTICRVS